jgi:hypothetical protein
LTLPRPKVPTQTRSQKGKARTFLVDDSDEGDVQEVMPRKDKAELPKAPPETSKPLFLNEATDALEGVDFGDNIHEDGVQKLELNKNPTSRPSTRARTGAKKKVSAVVIVDDDSDDGATFKGFTGKKLARR